MSEIQSVTAQPPMSRSTTYERSQSVQVTNSVQRQGNVRTEINTRITTSELKEITKIREELEALARARNQQSGGAPEETATAGTPKTEQAEQPANIASQVSLEPLKDYQTSLANAPRRQSGRLFNITV